MGGSFQERGQALERIALKLRLKVVNLELRDSW
jgi:hypothetical protein